MQCENSTLKTDLALEVDGLVEVVGRFRLRIPILAPCVEVIGASIHQVLTKKVPKMRRRRIGFRISHKFTIILRAYGCLLINKIQLLESNVPEASNCILQPLLLQSDCKLPLRSLFL